MLVELAILLVPMGSGQWMVDGNAGRACSSVGANGKWAVDGGWGV